MAGIGFRLQKLLSSEDYTGTVKAYAFSSLITAGPFIITVFTVLFIQRISAQNLTPHGLAYFQSLITYDFAFSLVSVGCSYLVLTRYVADDFYRGHVTNFSAVFFSAFTLNALFFGPWVFWYFSRLGVDWGVRLNAVLLYMFALGIWLSMIFLSAANNYWLVSRAFLTGGAVSLLASWGLGRASGFPGYFAGFVIGQGVVFLSLASALLKDFGYWEARDHYWVRYFKVYPLLAGIGFFYNLGIWIDKFVFWGSREGELLDRGLRYSPIYDSPMFFAYLSILPALVYFFLQVETNFFHKYHDYYKAIQDQEGLVVLERRRLEIIRSLQFSLGRLLVMQGITSAIALLLVPWIVQLAGMNPMQMSVLRIGIYAAFLQAGALIFNNILLYFDHQKEALRVSALFCVLNAVCTWVTLKLGFATYGYGYGAACFGAFALGVYYLNDRLHHLHYWTFMRQPLPAPIVIADEAEVEI